MDGYGANINPHIPAVPSVEEKLLKCFNENYGTLLLIALDDTTKRSNLKVFLWPYIDGTNFAALANYCVKQRKFDFIEYSVKTKRGAYYGKRFLI